MKELERKHNFVLETAKLIFQKFPDLIFIGGSALNTFYLDYRFSEDLDVGYTTQNKKTNIETLLKKNGYGVSRTTLKFRDVISLGDLSIKLDLIEYERKYSGFIKIDLGDIDLKTLSLDEFIISKTITFFTREEKIGLARDAYDLFAIQEKYSSVYSTLKKTKNIIKKNIISSDHNINIFFSESENMQSAVLPYLKEEVKYEDVCDLLQKIKVIVNE